MTPSKPTTDRDYGIWLREQTLQLLELILYGDDMVESGVMEAEAQGREHLAQAAQGMIQAMKQRHMDTYLPKVEGVQEENKR